MSFKLFIFYCAVSGGWFALAGWALGRVLAPESGVIRAVVQGTSLGMMVAFGLGLVDGLWNLSSRQFRQVLIRGAVIALLGFVGSLMGSAIGQKLYLITDNFLFIVLGWTLTGLLIGSSFGLYDTMLRITNNQALGGALKKMLNGILGGTLGGCLGSILFLLLRQVLSFILGKSAEDLISSSLSGFVALGVCIGLFIGLAQVMLKEAWLKVESGFRPGRELILVKPEVVIGRAEACDIGLFGDPAVEKSHARIVKEGEEYLLVDCDTPSGTFWNEQRIQRPTPLRSGDAIRIGRSVIRFAERQKREAPQTEQPIATGPATMIADNPFTDQ